jgi:hypothetical protein
MVDILFDTQEHEPLFPDIDDLPETFPVTDFGVQLHLQQIQRIDRGLERLKRQQADQEQWFQQRRLRFEEARERHAADTLDILNAIGERSCSTPFGTAFIRKSTTTAWPEDGVILEWVKAQPGDVRGQLLRTKESPDKAAIKDYMKASGKIVPGYETKEGEALSIRKVS